MTATCAQDARQSIDRLNHLLQTRARFDAQGESYEDETSQSIPVVTAAADAEPGFCRSSFVSVGAQRIRGQSIAQPTEFAGSLRRAEHV